jgi:hypothetical protein
MDRLGRTTKQSSQIQFSGSDLNRAHYGQLESEGYVKVSKHLKRKCISSQYFLDIRNGISLYESSQASPACPSDGSNIRMNKCVWITGGMILTGESRSTGI